MESITCKVCGCTNDYDDFDVMGGCEQTGGMFCPECQNEVDSDGLPTLLCGECANCDSLTQTGEFDDLQTDRINLRAKFVEPPKPKQQCVICEGKGVIEE